MGSNLTCCLPLVKAGGLQILCFQEIVVDDYNFTLDAVALKPTDFCNVRIATEYLGRGPDAEARARRRNDELGLKRTKPSKHTYGPSFLELAKAYRDQKDFSANSRKHLDLRLNANSLPFFGFKPAIRPTHKDVEREIWCRALISDQKWPG